MRRDRTIPYCIETDGGKTVAIEIESDERRSSSSTPKSPQRTHHLHHRQKVEMSLEAEPSFIKRQRQQVEDLVVVAADENTFDRPPLPEATYLDRLAMLLCACGSPDAAAGDLACWRTPREDDDDEINSPVELALDDYDDLHMMDDPPPFFGDDA